MNRMKKRILGIFVILLGMSVMTFAQTKDDVVNTYNKGVELANTDPKAAVELFEQALAMAKALGADADDIKQLIESQIPALQYKVATGLYKEKNITEAIPNFMKAAEFAELYGDDKTLKKSQDIIPKLYFSKGNSFYKAKTYDSAIVYFDKALELKPDYAKVYLSKGILYKKTDENDLMLESLNKAIEVGTSTGDEKTVKSAGKIIRDSYMREANNALKDENYQEAVALGTEATNFGEPKSQVYYILAVAHNKLSQWDEAITACNSGLAVEKDTNEDKAKFYFEMGNAYVGKGDNASACDAYTNAAFGNYAQGANYQMTEVLNCQ